MPTFGSLFAGIGGIDLGLERAGWECRFQVEWDDYCQRVLAKHWPDVPRAGDITQVNWFEFGEPVDLIAGGFPCQPVSVAGRQLAQEDDRWLWPEFARAIRALRPGLVLVENVPGLVAHGLGEVLGDLSALGYDARWDVVSAAAVGAPHLRERVWLVAGRPELGWSVADAYDGLLDAIDQVRAGRDAAGDGRPNVADAIGFGQPRPWQPRDAGDPAASGEGQATDAFDGGVGNQWAVESDVGGTLDGFPVWLDRSRHRLVTPHMLDLAYAVDGGPRAALREVWTNAYEETLRDEARGSERVSEAAVLFAYLCELEDGVDEGRLSLARQEVPEASVRGVREDGRPSRPSPQRRAGGERSGEPANALHALSQLLARDARQAWAAYRGQDAELVRNPWGPTFEDGIPRVATGVPARVDRLRALGNAVVPQVVEVIGRRLLEVMDAA